MDKRLPVSVKVTYLYIKGLAWGDRDVIFTAKEFFDLFGIPRSTLYRHLSLLAKYTVLRYRSSGNRTTGVVFVELLVDARKPDPSEDQIERQTGDSVGEEMIVSKMRLPYSSSSLNESKDLKDSLPEEEEYIQVFNNHTPAPQEKKSPKNETRSPKNETRSPKNETRSLKNETRSPKDETRSPILGTGFQRRRTGPYRNERQVSGSGTTGDGNIYKLYEANIGLLTPMMAEALRDAETGYPQEWIREAIQIAVDYNKRSWAYCKTILDRWAVEGKDSGRQKGDRAGEMSEVERLLLDLEDEGGLETDG